MSTPADLIDALASSAFGLTLAELLALRPDVSRRTAQRWIQQFLGDGRLQAQGAGRARRYRVLTPATGPQTTTPPPWVGAIPLSADSSDVLAYISQPVQARKPVGYQRDFLDAYQPNTSAYLSAPRDSAASYAALLGTLLTPTQVATALASSGRSRLAMSAMQSGATARRLPVCHAPSCAIR